MNSLFGIVVVVQVVSALAIIALVLLQHGKGADMGAAFGSGASGSLFGATGSSNFLSKSTGVAATIFFVATLALGYLGNKRVAAGGGVMERLPVSVSPASAGASASVAAMPAVAPASAPVAVSAGSAATASGQANQIPK